MRKTLKNRGRSKLRKTRKNPDYLSTNALTPEERDKIVREQIRTPLYSRMKQSAGRKRKRRRTKRSVEERKEKQKREEDKYLFRIILYV